jgi:hypothetical protein
MNHSDWMQENDGFREYWVSKDTKLQALIDSNERLTQAILGFTNPVDHGDSHNGAPPPPPPGPPNNQPNAHVDDVAKAPRGGKVHSNIMYLLMTMRQHLQPQLSPVQAPEVQHLRRRIGSEKT